MCLQFRFPSGPLATQTFKAKEPLSAVHCWLAVNRPAPSPHSAITLSTSYPKRVFTQEEMQMPLDSLGEHEKKKFSIFFFHISKKIKYF